jgi:hypothetical protein
MMNQRIKSTVLAVLIVGLLLTTVLIIAGCSAKDPLSPTAPSGSIMPLAVGNAWIYGMFTYSPPNTIPYDTAVHLVEILDSTLVGSELWYRARHVMFNPPSAYDTTFLYYANRSNGLYTRESVSDSAYLKVRYPAAVGLHFQSYYYLMGLYLGPVDIVVSSTNKIIETPVDTLSCHEYRLVPNLDPDWEYGEYYNPTYGYFASRWRNNVGGVWYPALSVDLLDVFFAGAPAPRYPEYIHQTFPDL